MSGIKSSYELAMERLQREQGASVALTDEQKADIAEVESQIKARLAEIEITFNGNLAEARAAGDGARVRELEEQKVRDIERCKSDGEARKAAIRGA
jgi:hypothetical protein